MDEARNVISLCAARAKPRPISHPPVLAKYAQLVSRLYIRAERWKAKGNGQISTDLSEAAGAIELLAAAICSAAESASATPVTSARVSTFGLRVVDLLWRIDAAEAVLPEEGEAGYTAANGELEVLYDKLDALCLLAWQTPARSLGDLATLAIIAWANPGAGQAHSKLVAEVLRMGGAINV